MSLAYSISKKTFYDTDLYYRDLPSDLVEITYDKHQELLNEMYMNNKDVFFENDEFVLRPRVRNVISWDEVRRLRNDLLSETDYTDTLSAKTRLGDILYTEWQEYRQVLRDIPQAYTDTTQIVWPLSPNEKALVS